MHIGNADAAAVLCTAQSAAQLRCRLSADARTVVSDRNGEFCISGPPDLDRQQPVLLVGNSVEDRILDQRLDAQLRISCSASVSSTSEWNSIRLKYRTF